MHFHVCSLTDSSYEASLLCTWRQQYSCHYFAKESWYPLCPYCSYPKKVSVPGTQTIEKVQGIEEKMVMWFPGAVWMGRQCMSPELTTVFYTSSQIYLEEADKTRSNPQSLAAPVNTHAQTLASAAL